MSPAARVEILDRLLEENHRRAATRGAERSDERSPRWKLDLDPEYRPRRSDVLDDRRDNSGPIGDLRPGSRRAHRPTAARSDRAVGRAGPRRSTARRAPATWSDALAPVAIGDDDPLPQAKAQRKVRQPG